MSRNPSPPSLGAYAGGVPTRGSADRLSTQERASWLGFLRVHARLMRSLDEDLQRRHRLPLTAYDVLVQLSAAPGRRLRMTVLAQTVLLSPSGLTRLVDQLEREGLVIRERCESDARGMDAVLTGEGRKRLRSANRAHLEGVRAAFLDRLSDAQLLELSAAWALIDPSAVAE
jgi:DNA-binding MarR family transcriptional regulator